MLLGIAIVMMVGGVAITFMFDDAPGNVPVGFGIALIGALLLVAALP
jgi:hypothetical protein